MLDLPRCCTPEAREGARVPDPPNSALHTFLMPMLCKFTALMLLEITLSGANAGLIMLMLDEICGARTPSLWSHAVT
eukprot:6212820-Pleurochrysis_carterae.AAC.2